MAYTTTPLRRRFGVVNNASPVTMTNVTVFASGGVESSGVYSAGSSVVIRHSNISASGPSSYGIYNTNASSGVYTVTISSSRVEGSTNTVYNDSQFTTRVGGSPSWPVGPKASKDGSVACIDVFDEDFLSINREVCP